METGIFTEALKYAVGAGFAGIMLLVVFWWLAKVWWPEQRQDRRAEIAALNEAHRNDWQHACTSIDGMAAEIRRSTQIGLALDIQQREQCTLEEARFKAREHITNGD